MDAETELTIERGMRYMAEQAHNTAKEHGFWDQPIAEDNYFRTLILIHSEISEAVEVLRKGGSWGEQIVPFSNELADIVIRVGDLAKRMNIDLGAAVIAKMEFNRTRPHKHEKEF